MEVRIRFLSGVAAVLLYVLLLRIDGSLSKSLGLCEVEPSQASNSIIFDIEESRGTQKNQTTSPAELPVIGDLNTEISLSLIFPKGKHSFTLNGKRLELIAPLDRDGDNLSHIVFQLSCTIRQTGKKKITPIIVRVSDINDNAPKFINTPYSTNISELTAIGTTIFKGVKAVDADAGVNGMVEYFVVQGNGDNLGVTDGIGKDRVNVVDGYGFFTIPLPHQGGVTVNRSLDYERIQRYLVTIVASDRAKNTADRFSSTSTLTVNVQDEDDQDPSFIYQGCATLDGACVNPEYYATVASGSIAGVLQIQPEKIQAIDIDAMYAEIRYSFQSGYPANFRNYFEIHPETAVVKHIRAVDVAQIKKFELLIKAEEQSASRRSTTAKLTIHVKPVDSNPPVIRASATEGSVDENSPIGTKVVDTSGKPIHITVTDADLGPNDPKPMYAYELTTHAFAITNDGVLVVNQRNLDRDPPSPSTFRFQILAREKNGNAASAPLYMAVTLNDQNDNAPKLPMIAPITLQAGETRRQVVKVEATDNDVGDNAAITYRIYHVSNNGMSKFVIDPKSGQIESVGKLSAGEQYSITVQATDKGGKFMQTIVEVVVVPGPNTKSPIFQQPVYDVVVSEGVSVNTTVTSVYATDPENGPVTYSIVSGNELREFGINAKTGVISVVRKLDREQLTQYQLIIKAEDEDSRSSTATVNIKVSDINDKNPEFVDLPYEFSVVEGKSGAPVGRVKAIDADEGQNAVVHYSLPTDVPFAVDVNTGDIRTKTALDYEQQSEYKFVVTAKDGAADPRLATATVTIKVTDTEDELPIFHVPKYEVEVPENVPDYVVMQVHADDPDTNKRITYVMRQGPTDLFTINRETGEVRTLKGLDYEKEVQHTLIIGTKENNSNKPGATTKIVVNVTDVNDVPPTFTLVPEPVTLEDDVPIGTHVTTLLATDSDGTAPNNKIRYEIVGRGKAAKYFQIDPDLGVLSVRNDLRKEADVEYQVDVKASDLGDPKLSTGISISVFIRHVATVAPDVGVGFADDSYTVQVTENSPTNTLVKTFTIVNNRELVNRKTPLKCTIVSGNSENIFYTNVTAEKNCELRVKDAKLDHEHEREFVLKIRLDTFAGLVNPERSEATVNIQVIDVNDNRPKFLYPESSKRFAKSAYFGAVARDREVSSPVIQIKTVDFDSDKFGQIEYHFVRDDDEMSKYFSVDPISGVIRTARGFDGLNDDDLPFRLVVEARDNPTAPAEQSNAETADVVINLIENRHRIILAINDARPDVVKKNEENITRVLEDHAKLIIGIEKIMPRQYRREDNVTLDTDQTSTDLWFYAIDPDTGTILERNNSRVTKSILETDASSNITLDVNVNLLPGTASSIHAPLMVITTPKTAIIQFQWEVFPYVWLLVAGLILVFGIIAAIYICESWSKYKAYKERMARMCITPRYDPVFVEPNLKEYETQVLQMSVPAIDDSDSYNDLQIDFSRKNHTFNLDNVGYISKDLGNDSPTNSDAATTTRASSMSEHHNNHIHHNGNGKINRAYQRSPEEDLPPNISSTNENVTFREKRDYGVIGYGYMMDRSPIETTTEL